MLNVQLEFRKGVLFVRLHGSLTIDTIDIFNKEVKEVIGKAGIVYVVLNVSGLKSIDSSGIKAIKMLKTMMKKTSGELFLSGSDMKELKRLVNLENELNVFERVVI